MDELFRFFVGFLLVQVFTAIYFRLSLYPFLILVILLAAPVFLVWDANPTIMWLLSAAVTIGVMFECRTAKL